MEPGDRVHEGQPGHADGFRVTLQWGGTRKARTGRELDGRTWDEFPVALVAGGVSAETSVRRLSQ